MTDNKIASDFPFQKNYIDVNGSRMAYVDEGEGPVVLFVHGNPTSSYLWRNVIPYVTDSFRAIAVDLIGMGDSDQPELAYTLQEHFRYLEAFVDALELRDVTLVGHDWGGALTTLYATRTSSNVKGIALMEAAVPPALPYSSLDDLGDRQAIEAFTGFRDPDIGPQLLMEQNTMVEGILPSLVVRELSEVEMGFYRRPYSTSKSRKPLYVFTNEIPIAGTPARNVEVMKEMQEWLATSEQPKLALFASPGMLFTEATEGLVSSTWANVETGDIGPGVHFVQEDQPDAIGKSLAKWLYEKS
ncbi:MAG: haloalkane dehalogenase [Acidobacteriota bacterium]